MNSPTVSSKLFIKSVGLLVIDEIHLLGEERGAVLESIVSRTRLISRNVLEEGRSSNTKSTPSTSSPASEQDVTRIIGLSTALANPKDLADWMGINVDEGSKAWKGLYNFRPSVRPIPMDVHLQGYPGRHYCPRMATMNKPAYSAIKEHSPDQPVLIFVSSRRQTRLTALDLISFAAADGNPSVFLGCDHSYIETVAETVIDATLKHTLLYGIAIHHAGLGSSDREIVESLFLDGSIQILVATATLGEEENLLKVLLILGNNIHLVIPIILDIV
jgi:activating signal cointegrator complex subunit 3